MSRELAMFGAGCFWGVEENFRQLDGVIETAVGYSGGKTDQPDYRQVCSGATGHAEVVQITYDSDIISYVSLLEAFWACHDPTQLDRQGVDVGDQYRSVIYYYSAEQKSLIEQSISAIQDQERFPRAVVTAVEPATTFFRAEEYHQCYLKKKGLGSCGF